MVKESMDLLELLRRVEWTETWTSFVRHCGC